MKLLKVPKSNNSLILNRDIILFDDLDNIKANKIYGESYINLDIIKNIAIYEDDDLIEYLKHLLTKRYYEIRSKLGDDMVANPIAKMELDYEKKIYEDKLDKLDRLPYTKSIILTMIDNQKIYIYFKDDFNEFFDIIKDINI